MALEPLDESDMVSEKTMELDESDMALEKTMKTSSSSASETSSKSDSEAGLKFKEYDNPLYEPQVAETEVEKNPSLQECSESHVVAETNAETTLPNIVISDSGFKVDDNPLYEPEVAETEVEKNLSFQECSEVHVVAETNAETATLPNIVASDSGFKVYDNPLYEPEVAETEVEKKPSLQECSEIHVGTETNAETTLPNRVISDSGFKVYDNPLYEPEVVETEVEKNPSLQECSEIHVVAETDAETTLPNIVISDSGFKEHDNPLYEPEVAETEVDKNPSLQESSESDVVADTSLEQDMVAENVAGVTQDLLAVED
ncbi:flocculation protein FLO1 [Spatholobus suberectus]|nr:flocculation protein FLO1 [Spatholobus suberectus]